ncbi:2-dehydropantoate 2-reductase [Aquabacterium sp. A7-Y]|uniref:2-dehydropantoate 2-reductase n=1 Tax=Aquabacterium sp. A7-Y TaxID=1349605 RepID=UPI00223DD3AE|nr:2-dehydropantoate 2-reductase [Aquabacterium sp. A7-Y]MCW7539009.1 2-dehydropantoate 2-reductase [Aquabacterium sp. A7-Y]
MVTKGVKVNIYGAGAIGGFIGARLAASGATVSAVARGANAAALRLHGWRLQTSDGAFLQAPVEVAEDPAALGPQDVVVVAVKGQALDSVARSMAPLLAPHTLVLTAMNGVPWWFFDGFGGPWAGLRLASVDPQGRIAKAIPTPHVIGCVVHATCSMPEPGLVRQGFGQRLILGEPAGGTSARVEALGTLLRGAGFEAEVSPAIQKDIWYKLWGNMTMNPVSALTGASCDRILDDPLVLRFCLDVMAEARSIGERIGCPIEQSGEERCAVTRRLGAFKTSMLQDVEAGRAIELDPLVGVVHEIARHIGLATPCIDALLGLTRLQARVRGLYPEA